MAFDSPSEGLSLQLLPSIWGAYESFPLEFWETSDTGTASVAGGSS
jgi:hypothetical protein